MKHFPTAFATVSQTGHHFERALAVGRSTTTAVSGSTLDDVVQPVISSSSWMPEETVSSSSSFLLLTEEIQSALPPPSKTFEAVMPDTSSLVAMVSIVAICTVAAIVWNNQVVPVSRTKLAISKSRGEVKEYLDDLKEAAEGEEDRRVEQWLFSDWLSDNKSKKAPAIPILKEAKWNSGDNPVVVTAAIMMLGIVIASLSERVIQ